MSDTLLDKNKIWQQIDDEKENMLQLWQELVNVDCGSGNKAGVDFIAQKIEAILKTLGFTTTQVEFEKAGNTLVGKIGDTSKDFIVLLGHMDTVFKDGTVAERPFKIVDGKAYGPGCLDMKGGIVIMMTALKVLLANNYAKHSIKVIHPGDEEVDHYLSKAAVPGTSSMDWNSVTVFITVLVSGTYCLSAIACNLGNTSSSKA